MNHFTPAQIVIIKMWEVTGKGSLYTAVRMQNGTAIMENSGVASQKNKLIKKTEVSRIPLLGIYPKQIKSVSSWKMYALLMFI